MTGGTSKRRSTTTFVILCYGRTGSTVLVDALSRHPDVRMYGEIFTLDAETGRPIADVDGRAWEGEDGAAFVRQVVFAPGKDTDAVGFKYMYYHANDAQSGSALDYVVHNRDVLVVHLTRDDLFASLVSLECAFRSGVWHVQGDAEPDLPVDPFPIEVERCRSYFERHERLRREMRTRLAGSRVLELEYARDIETGFDDTLRRVQYFLEVDERPLEWSLRKTAKRSLRAQVENYEELARAFARTPFSRWIPA